LPDFTTFDGGDTDPLSPISGPMWEEVTTARAKFIVGVGTMPIAPAGTGLVINVGDTGGEQIHKLITSELPKNKHDVGGEPAQHRIVAADQSDGGQALAASKSVTGNTQSYDWTQETGGDVAHNNL